MILEDTNGVVYKPTTVSELPQKLKPYNGEKKDTSIFLYFASFIVNMVPFMVGIAGSWLSPVSLKLLSPDPYINPLQQPITTLQLSLIGSLPAIGGVIGLFLLGGLFDVYGRKKIMIAAAFLTVISLVALALATNIYIYYISLIVQGSALSIGMAGTAMYSSEITEVHNRAMFVCFITVGIPLGNLAIFIVGPLCSVKSLSLVCTLPAVMYIVCFIALLPESPVFLISKGDIEGAKKALTKFRNRTPPEISEEIGMIESVLRESSKSEKTGLIPLIKNKATRKALFISLSISTCALCGVPAIMAFLDLIFEEAGTDISGFVSTMVVGSVQVFVCSGASMIVETFGRRQLLLISSLMSSLPLFVLSLFFYLKSHGFSITNSLGWLPITCLVVYLIFSCVGLGTVPMVFISEVFPNNVKSVAMSIVLANNFLVVGLAMFLFPIGMTNLGCAWNFFIIGVICLLAFIIVICVMPETRGKSLLEIQEILRK